MKTVWHWKNLGKSFLLVLLAGGFVSLLSLPPVLSFLVGMLAGAVAMMFSLAFWDCWHFE